MCNEYMQYAVLLAAQTQILPFLETLPCHLLMEEEEEEEV